MLLELTPGVAPAQVEAVNATVLALFEAIAADTAGDAAALIRAAWPKEGGSPPKRALRAVLELPAEERAELLRCVRDDLRFAESVAVAGFAFSYATLPEHVRRASTPLLRELYTTVLRGRGIALDGQPPLTRTTFERLFWDANPGLRVCPACLLQKLERLDAGSGVHVDHYLPKERYAPLSVHLGNLVPICGPCNTTLKKRLDPLDLPVGGPRDLTELWFPYRSDGLSELEVVVRPNRPSAAFELRGRDDEPLFERRASAHEELFDLEARWTDDVHGWYETLVASVRAETAGVGAPVAEAARAELERLARASERELQTTPGAFPRARYLRWLLADADAFDAFLRRVVESSATP